VTKKDRWLEYQDLEAVTPAVRNPKLHAKEKIDASLARFGYTNPVLFDERTGRLVAGHGRLEGLRGMRDRGEPAPDGIRVRDGRWLLPVMRGWSSKNDHEAEAYLLADNQLTTAGGWDEEQLAAMMRDLEAASVSIADLGWSVDEIQALTADPAPEGGDDPGPQEPPATPVSVVGEVYELGPHRLMCGDSTDPEMVARLMNGEKARLMATDPPYLVDYDGGNHPYSKSHRDAGRPEGEQDKRWDDYNEASKTLFDDFLRVALPHLFDDAPIYQWHAVKRQKLVEEAWEKNGLLFHQTILWVKPQGVLTRSDFMWAHEPCFYGWKQGNRPPKERRPPASTSNVWNLDARPQNLQIHPTQKPIEVCRWPISWHTLPGELCYEPFGGSGTCLMAAAMEGRRCFTMEKSPAFVDAIRRRWTVWAKTAGVDPGPGALE
jgi:DNA modification methylase